MTETHVAAEIATQPACWRQAATMVGEFEADLPLKGERVAVVGCGTSWFIAMTYAVLREEAGHGVTDAFAGSEFPSTREYDRIVAISRSGTTTEIIEVLAGLAETPSTLITAVGNSPASQHATGIIVLGFADEKSIVQTRFATTVLALLRAHLGADIEQVARDGELALESPIGAFLGAEQVSYVGTGWAIGLAHEAALKAREAAQHWTEAYPAMDYRHGPVAVAQPGRLVFSIGPSPEGLKAEVAATGADFAQFDLDAQATLIIAQRLAVALAEHKGLDPDHPRNLTRSVILTTT